MSCTSPTDERVWRTSVHEIGIRYVVSFASPDKKAHPDLDHKQVSSPLARNEQRADPAHGVVLSEIYTEHVRFVWRSLRRMGVQDASLEDAVQDVFLVVHRRLAEFQARSQMRTWLFGIVLRVAQSHRRTVRRRQAHLVEVNPLELDAVSPTDQEGPAELTTQREASALLHRLLSEMAPDRRAILVMVELEQMSVREAAEALGINLNTAYSRLRAARAAFEAAVAKRADDDARNETEIPLTSEYGKNP
jgi:RNA polymerase sigma-70 factor (ECF subfamily)